MERKTGEIFEYNGDWLQCIEGHTCAVCYFRDSGKCNEILCTMAERTDVSSVYFKKLEKVGGEPFTCIIHGDERLVRMQEYKLYDVNFCKRNDLLMYVSNYKHKRIAIEIKQNKEDMERKKIQLSQEEYDYIKNEIKMIPPGNTTYDTDDDRLVNEIMDMFSINTEHSNSEKIGENLKEFDLEAAKSGKPVCTRDGRKARIICFDRLTCDNYSNIVACVTAYDGKDEYVIIYGVDGYIIDSLHPKPEDLMMLPEKKEGWINLYKAEARLITRGSVYNTKDDAVKSIYSNNKHVATVKIEWEG